MNRVSCGNSAPIQRGRSHGLSLFLIALSSLLLGAAALDAGTVRGRVLDTLSGKYLDGVVVRVQGTDLRTTTDRGGNYVLTNVPEGSQTIVFDYLGYPSETESVNVGPGLTTVDGRFAEDIEELQAFTIEGQAVGQAEALNIQRRSAVNASVVSADAIGRFPDQNAAEALNRLPGVSLERDQGEGRFVVIRGIDPNLNTFAIDGVRLASPDAGDRATLLDTIPSETLQRLEVYKSVLPSMPGDAIGGYVNIKTPSAYDYEDTVVRLSAQMDYSDLVDEWKGKINGSYGAVSEDGGIGFMVSATYSEREFGSDNNESGPWTIEDGIDGTSGYISEEIEFREYNLTRTRTGLSANLEFKPEQGGYYYVRGSYNNYQDVEFRHAGIFEMEEFSGIVADGFNALGAEHVREMKDREENLGVRAASVGGENSFDNWKVDYRLSYSYAEEDTPYDFESIYEFGDTVDVRFGGTQSYTLNLGQIAGPDLSDPANYQFDEVTSAFQLVEEEDLSGEFNASYYVDSPNVDRIQFGVLHRQKTKTSDPEEFASDDNPGEVDTLTDFVEPNRRDPLNLRLPYVTQGFRSYFLDNEDAFAMERDLAGSVVEDFESDEDVTALYLMGVFNFSGWELIAGARYEDTDFSTSGLEYNDDTETVETVASSKGYDHFLPGVHLRREINDNAVFRFSYNESIARPSFEQTFPNAEIEGDEVTVGNPELDPYESTNWDVSFEYYLEPLGVLSASVFYKEIDNFIYEQTLIRDFNGITDAEVTTFLNGPSGDLQGLELGWQQQLNFLPSPFDGLGIVANVTLVDGEAEVLGPEDGDPTRTLPFVKQSETISSLALSYEKYGFFFRVAASYRDDYLDEVGPEPLEDRYIDDFLQFDITSSYQINENVSVFANFLNIDNEPFRAYFGESNRLSQWESYSWSANFGVKWSR